jgi:hypothetical protein
MPSTVVGEVAAISRQYIYSVSLVVRCQRNHNFCYDSLVVENAAVALPNVALPLLQLPKQLLEAYSNRGIFIDEFVHQRKLACNKSGEV